MRFTAPLLTPRARALRKATSPYGDEVKVPKKLEESFLLVIARRVKVPHVTLVLGT